MIDFFSALLALLLTGIFFAALGLVAAVLKAVWGFVRVPD